MHVLKVIICLCSCVEWILCRLCDAILWQQKVCPIGNLCFLLLPIFSRLFGRMSHLMKVVCVDVRRRKWIEWSESFQHFHVFFCCITFTTYTTFTLCVLLDLFTKKEDLFRNKNKSLLICSDEIDVQFGFTNICFSLITCVPFPFIW